MLATSMSVLSIKFVQLVMSTYSFVATGESVLYFFLPKFYLYHQTTFTPFLIHSTFTYRKLVIGVILFIYLG